MIRLKKKTCWLLSLALTFSLLFSCMPIVHAEGEDEVTCQAVASRATVVGNFMVANSLGEKNWDAANIPTTMNQYGNTFFEKTVTFTTPGSYEYKIAMDGGWDESYGKDGGSDNIPLNVTEAGSVTFKFNYKTKEIFDSINNPDAFKESATLVGDLPDANWDPTNAAYDMDYIGKGFYKKAFTLAPATYQYKVAYNHAWNNGEVGSNVSLDLSSATEDTDVTFIANPDLGICTDSINTPEILKTLSLIGTIRPGDDKDWTETEKGYEFSYLNNDGLFIYDGIFQSGDYKYKVIENYSWNVGGIPSSGDKTISIPNDNQYVIFIADPKNGTVIDSINNPEEIDALLGFEPIVSSDESVIIEKNGSVTFRYTDADASEVYVAGSFTDWNNLKEPMYKIEGTDVWEANIRIFDDSAQTYEYKFVVDGNWINDPNNENINEDRNNTFDYPEYTGRQAVLVGTIQTVAGETAWTPGSEKTQMDYIGCGQYSITIEDVPAGTYEYKVAMGGSWDECYDGNGYTGTLDNISLTVPETQDVTFYYSDDSHLTATSINYKMVDASLTGTGVPENTKLIDPFFEGIFSAKVFLTAGTYSDLTVHVDSKDIPVGTITLTEDKVVEISYDPVSGIVYNNSSDIKLNDDVYFDSRNIDYKSPYGAAKVGEEITFNLDAGSNNLTIAKLKIVTPNGVEVIDMNKNGTFENGNEKWTAKYTTNTIGTYSYAFIISNGTDAKAYADDDGLWGEGRLNFIGRDKDFGFNVYEADFETPDWMKNAVVYQIFPDRFFNGDLSNDYNQFKARGFTDYEFYNDWYSLTEIPDKIDEEGYVGPESDGVWCNEIYGGDLKGIEQKLDYLQSLGVTVIYMNPISQSISNHRYDATDYRELDPILGNMEEFESLAKAATERGMHIILDGVFNHVSDDSIYFDRYGFYVEEGKPLGAYQYWSSIYDKMAEDSGLSLEEATQIVEDEYKAQGITDFHYAEWFKIDNEKVDVGTENERYNYEGWWGYDSMPVIQALDGSEYNVTTWADEIIDGEDANSRYWLEKGSDGWRLDVANEVSDETWEHFRDAVKEEGDYVIIGEIWEDASRYLLGNMYDSVMNYRFRAAVIDFVCGYKGANEITENLELIREQYPKEAFDVMLNLVDSHDTERILFNLNGENPDSDFYASEVSQEAKEKMYLVPLMQMTYPGAPCIYYGDEIGMTGGKDPDCRRGMIWGQGDKDLVEWYAKLANIRNNYEVLRTGDIIPHYAVSDDVYSFERTSNDDFALVLINRGDADTVETEVSVANGTVLTNVLDPTQTYTVADGKVTVAVPAIGGVILVKNYKETSVNYENLESAYNPEYVVETKTAVTSIEINQTEASLEGDETLKLEATVTPENATCQKVYWKSSDENIATVSQDGTVTGIRKGTATITAISYDGHFEKVCTITVTSDGTVDTGDTGNTETTCTPNPHYKTTTTVKVDDIAQDLVDGDKLTIKTTTDNKTVSGNVLKEIKGKDVAVTVKVADGIEWSFNGKDIPEDWEPRDINFNLDTEKSNIPDDTLSEFTNGKQSKTLSLDYNGEFGFEIKLIVHIGYFKEGMNANIYFYNPETKEFELTDSCKINSSGDAEFNFEHASEYVILVSDNSESDSDTSNSTDDVNNIDNGQKNPKTGQKSPVIPTCLAIFMSVSVIANVRKKKI